MRILVVIPTFFPVVGGAEVGVYEIYRRLAERHSVRVLTPYLSRKLLTVHGSQFSSEMTQLDVRRFHDAATLARGKVRKLWRRFLPPVSLSYVWALRRETRAFKPDVLNMHYVVPGGLALRLAGGGGKVPSLLSLVSRSDVCAAENPDYREHPGYFLKVLQSASRVTALTRYMLPDPVMAGEAEFIPYGVDLQRFNPETDSRTLRRELGLLPGAKVLFCLQRLIRVKRVDFLIESLKQLVKVQPAAVLIIGGKGPEEARLRSLVQELGLAAQVIFAGFIEEPRLPEYFALSDLFVFASESETFGVVLAQALASGRPIAALKSSCLAEVVDDGKNGLLIDGAQPAMYAEAIAALLGDTERLSELARCARRKAEACYSWDEIARRYEQLLNELVLKRAECQGILV